MASEGAVMGKSSKSADSVSKENGDQHVVIVECTYTFFVGVLVDGPEPKSGPHIPVEALGDFPKGMFDAACKLYGWPAQGVSARPGHFKLKAHRQKKRKEASHG